MVEGNQLVGCRVANPKRVMMAGPPNRVSVEMWPREMVSTITPLGRGSDVVGSGK